MGSPCGCSILQFSYVDLAVRDGEPLLGGLRLFASRRTSLALSWTSIGVDDRRGRARRLVIIEVTLACVVCQC